MRKAEKLPNYWDHVQVEDMSNFFHLFVSQGIFNSNLYFLV